MSDDNIQNLPIDIHYNKLLDWLINRRHCAQQWQIAAVEIRQKINCALDDMPAVEEIRKLIEGANVNYFHSLKILELLKNIESEKKTIFGQYESQRLKNWSEIIKLYEKDGVYLAETAQMIARNVNYEVPALKKQITRCQQTEKDCIRKENDYVNNSGDLKKKYEASCKQLGIQGKKIKSELSALVRDLPSEYSKLAEKSQGLENVIDYYETFSKFVLNREELGEVSVPMLRHVIANGNTTTYHWKYGRKPDQVEEMSIVIDTTDEEDTVKNPGTIDWVDDTGDADGSEVIEFGDNIEFDISEITLEDTGIQVESQTKPGETGAGDAGTDVDSDIANGIAKGENALTILDNPKTRNEFLNDLYELEAFLIQRLNEVKNEEEVLSGNQFQSAPQSIQIDTVSVATMLNDVRSIINQLTSVQMQHLMLIHDSPRYVDRLRDRLRQTLQLSEKMLFYEKEMAVKRKQALLEQATLEPKLDVLIENTRTMQKQMEGEISKKYKGRIVNIMGEINMM